MKLKELFSIVEDVAKEKNLSTPYICGGVARDFYMRRLKKISDIDITTGDKTVFKLAVHFYDKIRKKYKVDVKQSTDGHITIFFPNMKIDFSSNFIINDFDFSKYKKNPTELDKEVYSRDFTCNSLLLDMQMKNIIDITNRGIKDIDNKIVSTILEPEITLMSNKNRVVRSIYVACNLGFDVDEKIINYVKNNPISFNKSTKNVVLEKLHESFKKDERKAYDLITKMNLWNIIPIDEELKKYYIKHQGLINK
jgi:tRNA nucleotidyltransferase/poly(A) polymerase